MTDLPKYEYLETTAVKGFEAKTKAKYLNDGWELVSEEKKALRTALKFRREKKPVPIKFVALGAATVLALIAIISFGALTEGEPPTSRTQSQEQKVSQSDEPADGSDNNQELPDEAIITVENNSDLSLLLSDKDQDTDFWQEFFDKYHGRTLEFDGNIALMQNTPGYKFTVDCLVEAGNYSETSSIGPPFRAPMINIHTGFNVEDSGDRSTLFQGDNIRVVAQLVDYNSVGQTFEIDIVSTKIR